MTNDEPLYCACTFNRHGKFYACTALADEKVEVAIIGPYATERKAEKALRRWTSLNREQIEAGEALVLLDAKTVPDDVRLYITETIKDAIKQDTPNNPGIVFGKVLR